MKTVYLAGPIAGEDWAGATGWRDDAEHALALWGIKALSPMRGMEFMSDTKSFSKDGGDCVGNNSLRSMRGIMTRDYYDCTNCDVLLVNVSGAKQVSIGTSMEIAWAYQKRTPIVLVSEGAANPHEHGMINEAIGYKVATLAEAIDIVRLILGVKNPLDTYVPQVARGQNVMLFGQRGAA